MSTLPPYPTSVDPEIWSVVAQMLAGHPPAAAHAIHCAVEAGRFCLGLAYPDPPLMTGGVAQVKLTPKNVPQADVEAFVKHMATPEDAVSHGMRCPDKTPEEWLGIAIVLWKIALSFITC